MKQINHINEPLHFPFQALARLDVLLSSLQLALLASRLANDQTALSRDCGNISSSFDQLCHQLYSESARKKRLICGHVL